MKTRITANSIRFRLKQTEVKSFAEHGSITEMLELGATSSEQLAFSLKTGYSELSVHFSENHLTVFIPESISLQWTTTDMVGISHSIRTSTGKIINILIEKDFACLDATDAENIDTYPNPKAVC